MNTTSVGKSANQRNRVPHLGLHHFNPPSLDSKLTRKGKLGKNRKVLQGTKGMQTQAKVSATMDYSSLALHFLCLQCIQRVPYIAHQWGNERSNPSDLKAYGREASKSDPHQGKLQNNLDFFTHPDVHGFRGQTSVYTR